MNYRKNDKKLKKAVKKVERNEGGKAQRTGEFRKTHKEEAKAKRRGIEFEI